MRIGQYLKHSMSQNQSKSGKEIIQILKRKDENEEDQSYYIECCKQLVFANILYPIQPKHSIHRFMLTEHYKFQHFVYDQYRHNKRALHHQNISNKSSSSFGGGTQVIVYSPKSCKWRPGLVLSFDEATNKGRVCCYNSMGKQCIKMLSLPSPLVSPVLCDNQSSSYQHQQRIPMTVDSWSRHFRDGTNYLSDT